MYYTPSEDILQIKGINWVAGIPAEIKLCTSAKKAVKGYVGQGRKPSGQKAKLFADQSGSQFISVEEGFLFKADDSCQYPLSLIVDFTGVHYDASSPSDLECHLNSLTPDESQLTRASLFIKRYVDLKLTKFGPQKPCINFEAKNSKDKPCVLVLDQIKGDYSLKYGLADESSFRDMLEFISRTFPQHRILVKRHPLHEKMPELACVDFELAQDFPAIEFLDPQVTLDQALEAVTDVFTVTSQAGLDALLRRKEVWCFGAPFYSGWGLTHDFAKVKRRTAVHSLESFVYIAFFEYAQYLNPALEETCSAEECLDLIEAYSHRKNFTHATLLGFSSAQANVIKPYLGDSVKVESLSKLPAPKRLPLLHRPFVFFKSNCLRKVDENEPKIFVEDGFICSARGLEYDPKFTYSYCLDEFAPYYVSDQVTGLEHTIASTHLNQDQRWRVQGLIEMIVSSDITRYTQRLDPVILENRVFKIREKAQGHKVILIVGQSDRDPQVLKACGPLRTMDQLIQKVRFEHPHAFLVYCPGPELALETQKNAPGSIDPQTVDWVETGVSASALLACADEVHTLTSLVGFEALLRGKQVFCYGYPFYAGWGLTRDFYKPRPRIRPSVTLMELVYACLIAYPYYRDPVSGTPISVESAINRILLDLKHESKKEPLFKSSIPRFFSKLKSQFKEWA